MAIFNWRFLAISFGRIRSPIEQPAVLSALFCRMSSEHSRLS